MKKVYICFLVISVIVFARFYREYSIMDKDVVESTHSWGFMDGEIHKKYRGGENKAKKIANYKKLSLSDNYQVYTGSTGKPEWWVNFDGDGDFYFLEERDYMTILYNNDEDVYLYMVSW